ncbi:T9SS-dependent M36 family metallopeptidase [Flavobacterium sp.]|uniref:T9SS-dependent M36 family metallopeptidase n=1 Tax=Flavobacterium sp. TaxID=239 RepID=UPI003527D3AA
MKNKLLLSLSFLFCFTLFAQEVPQSKIQNFLAKQANEYNLTTSDISQWSVESTGSSKATGIQNFYINQMYNGIVITNSLSNVWYKNGEVLDIKNSFVANIASKVNTTAPSISVLEALNYAHNHNGEPLVSHQIIEQREFNKYVISNGNIEDDVRAQLVYLYQDDQLKLAWKLQYYSQDYNHLWDARISATNGELLEKFDGVLSCNFGTTGSHKGHNHEVGFYFNKLAFANKNTSIVDIQDGSYRVFPYYTESPNHGSRQLLSGVNNLVASPHGWHDINGVDGPEFTTTQGNNVHAVDDTDGNNSGGTSPNGGSSLVFDYPYGGVGVTASSYLNAATTNLFYMNNIMHDVWYQYGFDEPNGNFQRNNYGNGGTTSFLGDYVLADAQDGGGTNNANFSTPPDGDRPRMQMYLWDVGPVPLNFVVNSPASVAGEYYASNNVFDPGHVDLPAMPGIAYDLVLYEDATPDTSDACEAPVNGALFAGKTVVIRRGICTFVDKVLMAQNAGAAAVVIVNNDTANPNQYVNMSGANAAITIPAVFIPYNLGEAIIAAMASGTVNVTLRDAVVTFVNSDGDFDNGVIAHEYTHGISTRLTGGPNTSCLNNQEQMGEGWSDWAALMMQIEAGDNGTETRGIATFVAGQPTNGPGIRTYPYSTDMSICPFTFADTNTEAVPHGVGSVWTAMLWDLTWAYIDKYGFDPDIYNGNGGNNKVMQLVLDGMKLQGCNPTFISARNALIAADQATTGGEDFCLIWEVFARRGLGVNASSGSANSATDQVEDFTEPAPGPNCVLSVDYFKNQELIRVYPNPTNGKLNLRVNNYNGVLNVEVFDLNGRKVMSKTLQNFSVEDELNITSLQSGMYLLKLTGNDISYSKKIIKN